MNASGNLGDLIGTLDQRTAIIDLSGGAPLLMSRQELDRLAQRVARGLVAAGLSRGQRIGILAENSARYVAVFLGAMRAGVVPVPINIRLPAASIAFLAQDAALKMMFVDARGAPLAPSELTCTRIDTAAFEDFAPDGKPWLSVRPAPDETAFILYTSGSTGRPKGVPLSHHGQIWAVGARARSTPDLARHRYLIAAPLFHMNALFATKLVLANDASMVLLPAFETGRYISAIEDYRCTWLTSVPTMIAMLMRESELLSRADFGSVEVIGMGSAPAGAQLFQTVHGVFPKATIFNNYGTTEGGAAVFGFHPQGLPRPLGALGYPLADIDIRLVAASGEIAEEGVMQLRTPAVTKGYLNLPQATLDAFAPGGWYITGDIMRRDAQGFYAFVGRADDMFKCGGESIYPGEVEQMLERHPGVAQACVVPIADAIKGNKPIAFIVARETSLSAREVQDFALAHAPAYQHPRHVFFLPALPLSGANKIDRRLLAAQAKQMIDAKEAGA